MDFIAKLIKQFEYFRLIRAYRERQLDSLASRIMYIIDRLRYLNADTVNMKLHGVVNVQQAFEFFQREKTIQLVYIEDHDILFLTDSLWILLDGLENFGEINYVVINERDSDKPDYESFHDIYNEALEEFGFIFHPLVTTLPQLAKELASF